MHEINPSFILTAHRGAVDVAPENTLLAFQEAEELGIIECELDIQQSNDGVLVVAHDRVFDRLAIAGSGQRHIPIEQQTYAELQKIDLGLGQRIPTFDEVLDSTGLLLQVEIKAPRAAVVLAETLNRRSVKDRERCVVTSFHPHGLKDFQRISNPLSRGTGLLVASLASDWRYDAKVLGVGSLYLHWPGLTRELVDELHQEGFRVCASMFNHAGDLARIVESNVDGSSTDRPRFTQDLLR